MSSNVNLDSFEENLTINWEKVVARQNKTPFTCPIEWWQTKEGTPIEMHLGEAPGWAMGLMRSYDPSVDTVLFSAAYIVAHSYDFLGEPFFYDNKKDGVNIPIPRRLEQMQSWVYKIAEKSDSDVLINMVNDMAVKNEKLVVTPEDVKEPLNQEIPS